MEIFTIIWTWFASTSPEKLILALAALMTAFRIQSNRQHSKQRALLNGENGLLARLGAIEERLQIVQAVGVRLGELEEKMDRSLSRIERIEKGHLSSQ